MRRAAGDPPGAVARAGHGGLARTQLDKKQHGLFREVSTRKFIIRGRWLYFATLWEPELNRVVRSPTFGAWLNHFAAGVVRAPTSNELAAFRALSPMDISSHRVAIVELGDEALGILLLDGRIAAMEVTSGWVKK